VPKSDRSFDLRAYATVAERITLFYRQFPEGRIITELAARDEREITFKALAFRHHTDPVPAATGWASERYDDGGINSVACLENTETSAVGRALANLGFTASLQRPSREEMEKAERARAPQVTAVHEIIQLLATARALGFSPRRSEVIEQRVNQAPGLHLPDMRRLEQRVRVWLRRRGM
jgi:hypothetical protein